MTMSLSYQILFYHQQLSCFLSLACKAPRGFSPYYYLLFTMVIQDSAASLDENINSCQPVAQLWM
jgi:hypothetical protein